MPRHDRRRRNKQRKRARRRVKKAARALPTALDTLAMLLGADMVLAGYSPTEHAPAVPK